MPEAGNTPTGKVGKILLPSAELTPEETFKMLTGSIVPRPIAWTSTISRDGIPNLAPFSFFTVVSNRPPMVSLTLESRTDGSAKDTLLNIRETGEYVINIVSAGSVGKVYGSSLEFAPEIDEFGSSGAGAARSVLVKAPSVEESLINLECVLREVLWPGSDALIIGEIVAFRVHPSVLAADGRIDLVELDSLARVAAQFAHVGKPFLPSGSLEGE